LQAEPRKLLGELAGLDLRRLRLVDHDDRAGLCLGGQRVPETERADLLGQIEFMAVRHRAHRLGAADEQRRGTGAVTGGAAALLLAETVLGAVDLGAGQRLVLAGAALGELPDDDALDEVGARLETEDLVLELDLAGRLVVQIEDLGLHLSPQPFLPAPSPRASSPKPASAGSCADA